MDDINFVYKLVKGSIKQTITQMGKKIRDHWIDSSMSLRKATTIASHNIISKHGKQRMNPFLIHNMWIWSLVNKFHAQKETILIIKSYTWHQN